MKPPAPVFSALIEPRPSGGSPAPSAAAAISPAPDVEEDEEEETEPEPEPAPAAEPAPVETLGAFDRARLLLTGKKELANQLLTARAEIAQLSALRGERDRLAAAVEQLTADLSARTTELTTLRAERVSVATEVTRELTALGVTPEEAPATGGDATPTTRAEAAAAYHAEKDPARKREIYNTHRKLLLG